MQRSTGRKGTEDRTTTYDWLVDVRTFFADICTWGTEPGSPLAQYVPVAMPLTSHDLNSGGFAAARARTTARMTASVMDLTREIPNIRAYALRAGTSRPNSSPPTPMTRRRSRERNWFWDWALLELLLTSGLRVEEASELTTLDILKRRLRDGRIYYLLHVKPSKYDRARVIPIGDGLGRVIAEIIGHVKAFYGPARSPPATGATTPRRRRCRARPTCSKAPDTPARCRSLQSAAACRTSPRRRRRHADGTPLVLRPHDCRRVFASEHLNNNTPVHVMPCSATPPGHGDDLRQALPGHPRRGLPDRDARALHRLPRRRRVARTQAAEWAAFARTAICATWAPTSARCRPASTAPAAWSAWAVTTPNPKRLRHRCFGA